MNERRGNIVELFPGVSRPPRREDYEPVVRALRLAHSLTDEEVQLRASLLLMRDRALATKASERTSEYAWRVLDVVHRIADDFALNHRVDVASLREIRRNCLNLVCAASNFDAMFRERASDPKGAA